MMSPAASEEDKLPDVVRAMLHPSFYPGAVSGVELVQTHISFVFLTDREVYKIKKSVRFSFLDFSTARLRHHFCREEVRLNRRLAPDVYLGVVSICPTANGYRLGSEDDATAVEYAVRMRRLPEERMLSSMLERGDADEEAVDLVAGRLVEFHRDAATGGEIAANGSPEALREIMRNDFSESDRYRGWTIGAAEDRRLQAFCFEFIERHDDLLRCRQREGRIREGHGDLRAEHVCFVNGIEIIDCVEFEPRFRHRDVAAEVAFLAMDIEHLGAPALARRLIDRYAIESDDAAVPFLAPFYQCYYAYIRGKVESLTSLEEEVGEEGRARAARSAKRLFAQARRYSWAYSPALVAVVGLSGSGKTTVAREIAARLGFSHYNSDVIRKELAGCPSDRPATEEAKRRLYSADASRRTYATMRERARRDLEAGRGVVLDATFQLREHRREIDDLARDCSVAVLFVECTCDESVIRERLERRARAGTGPSDADWAVYLAQRRVYEGLGSAEHERSVAVDTSEPAEEIAARVEEALRATLEIERRGDS